jgi:protein-S-isoprenylcysteine O-methyltransferase Ste14
MKATHVVFRFRFLIHAVIFLLGFNVPWDYWLHFDMDASGSTWLLLSTWLARNHWLSFSGATVALLIFGAICALKAALLRTFGSAYMGFSTVQSLSMHGDKVVAAGPYRYVRNPLYLGIIMLTFSLALLMPPSGAIFSIICVILFELALIAGEEPFLTEKLGQSYLDYRARVPKLIPALSPRIPASEAQPNWRAAFLGETFFWGFFLTWLIVGWRYNAILMAQGTLISLGLSLVVRAILPRKN